MKKRTVNENSLHNRVQERQAEYAGGYPNEGKPWTDADMNKLLDAYFLGWPFLAKPGKLSVCGLLGRKRHACETQLWKTFVRYPKRLSACRYRPGTRTPRAGEPLTARDCTAFAFMFSKEGFKNCAANSQWAGDVVGRSPQEVYGILNAIVSENYEPGGLDDDGPPEPWTPHWNQVVHNFCKAKAERLEKEG
jgi:hypothetical protein